MSADGLCMEGRRLLEMLYMNDVFLLSKSRRKAKKFHEVPYFAVNAIENTSTLVMYKITRHQLKIPTVTIDWAVSCSLMQG